MNTKTYCAIFGPLTFETAAHVGVGRGNVGTDSPLRRNGRGELALPGTALGGALRSLATRLASRMELKGKRGVCLALMSGEERKRQKKTEKEICGCAVCRLFGELYPGEERAEEKGGRASRLWVYDARLISAPRPFVRDGVGIDRVTGAAARAGRIKFDTEVLPAGAIFELRLELEDASHDDERLLAATLAEWQAGRTWLGGDAARGLGRAKLGEVQCVRNGLTTGDELLAFLRADDPRQVSKEDEGWLARRVKEARIVSKLNGSTTGSFIEVEFALAIDGPFVTHDTTVAGAMGFDHVSLLDGVPGLDVELRPIIPGSGLRGALRSHAERIARTLATVAAEDKKDEFLRTCPACNPVEDRLDAPLTKCDRLLTLPPEADVEETNLCLSCQLFGSSRRGSRLRVMDAPLVGEPVWKAIDFLAIDRFTGGGLESAKFDAAALWRPTFAARLYLEEPQEWELGWLALVLRDLAEGRIAIGFGGAKGFGQATAKEIRIRCGFAGDAEWDGRATSHELKDRPGFYRMAEFTGADWAVHHEMVEDWVKAFHRELKKIDRAEGDLLPPPRKDSYFAKDTDSWNLARLYPVKEASRE